MGIFDIFSNKPADRARDAQIAGLNQGFTDASKYLQQGTDRAVGRYDQASGRFDQFMPGAQGGYNAYGDAAGAYGSEGFNRAMEAYRNSPYYRSGLETGLDALDRRAVSRGQLNSGQTTTDTLRFASDLEDRNFGQYVSALSPYLNLGPQIAGQQAQIDMGAGNLYGQQGGALADLAWQRSAGIGEANAGAHLARYQTSANAVNAIKEGVSLATKLVGFM